jgi:hypothetical protein
MTTGFKVGLSPVSIRVQVFAAHMTTPRTSKRTAGSEQGQGALASMPMGERRLYPRHACLTLALRYPLSPPASVR